MNPPNEQQQLRLAAVPPAYSLMWAAIRPPYPCDFQGLVTDIEVLDFIGYEAGHHPLGLFGAAVIWGNVLVATGAVRWVVGDEGSFFLASPHDSYPRYLVWPYARVVEAEGSSVPQYGKYSWVLQKTLVDLLAHDLDEDIEARVRALFDRDDDFWRDGPGAMERMVRRP